MKYIWFSIYVKVDYLTYINLIKVFDNIDNIYGISNNEKLFKKILFKNNIILDSKVYSNLINSNLKIYSKTMYEYLKNNNIHVIDINSKLYPKQLKNIYNPPLVIFAYGDLALLNNTIVYVYHSNSFSSYGKKVLYNFSKLLLNNNISVITDEVNNLSNIVYLPYIQKIENQNILVISDKIEKIDILNSENITGISNYLLIPEASYNKKVVTIVDLMLEQGKDILVVPGSIYNDQSYFSNFLLKEGAFCINSNNDLMQHLK